eukprot:Em0009g531a
MYVDYKPEKDTFLSRFEAAKQLYAPGCKRNATISVLIECFAGPCIDPTRDVQASSSRTSFSRNEMMLDSAGIYTGEEDASDQNLLVVELYLNKLYQQVVTDVAEESMKAAVERVKESPHHATSGEWVITDARHDSTSNAYHSTVPCLAGSSTEFVLPQVIAQGLNITEVAHGYQATIKQYVQQLGMVNSYDTWHGTKNVAKQLHRICASMVRTRDRTWFTELFDKARCTKVHLYWCMRNCGGNPDCLRAMIVNISKHFQEAQWQKKSYDSSTKCRTFNVGDAVWLHVPTAGKLEAKWEGGWTQEQPAAVQRRYPQRIRHPVLRLDDTSGNKSKIWNKFDSWCFQLAGLPKKENANLQNIHFMCSSNKAPVMEKAKLLFLALRMALFFLMLYCSMICAVTWRLPLICSAEYAIRISRNIAKYYKSFVGRNFKALAQMALFVLSPFLAPAEIEVWLALSKVFKFTYCDRVNPESMGYHETIVQNFVATTVVHSIFLLYGGSPKSTCFFIFLNICECLFRHLVITPKACLKHAVLLLISVIHAADGWKRTNLQPKGN